MREFGRFIALILCSSPIIAATEWTAATSDNFELITTGGARKARAGIQHFEEVRDFFVRALHFEPKLRQKVRLIAFDSPQEWKRFTPSEAAAAFYRPGLDRDVIAMESLRGEVYQVAVHEYVHLLLRHSGGSFPVWLNEGLAELYSSMNVQGGKMRVGDIHLGRYQLLRQRSWLPMEQLIDVDHESPIYKAKAHAGIFYSQSWALVHMLVLGKEYSAKVGTFLQKVAFEEVPAPKAFQELYGKSLFQVQKDLENYLSSNSIRIYLFDYKPEKPPKPETREATPFEVDLAQARLLSRAEDAREADEIFQRLEQQNAADLELSEAHGFHLLYRGQRPEARQRFKRAIDAGSRNPKVYMQYAFLTQSDAVGESVTALQKALEFEPGDKELRYYLGRMLLQAKRYAEALSALTEARPVPPEHAIGYLESLVYIYLVYKNPQEARKLASRAQPLAKSDEDRRRASALLLHVTQWEQAMERAKQYEEQMRAQVPAGVTVVERPDPRPVPTTPVAVPTVTGKLRQVECMGQRATLHVFTEGKVQRFVIEDPGSVQITSTGNDSATAELSCGPQKDVPVSVGHVGGVVRTLGFR